MVHGEIKKHKELLYMYYEYGHCLSVSNQMSVKSVFIFHCDQKKLSSDLDFVLVTPTSNN